MERKHKKILFYLLAAANLGIIIYFWWRASGGLLGQGAGNSLLALGRLAGLLLVFQVLMQFVLMGRARALESAWGLDRLSRIHHWNGVAVLLLLALHPVLTAAAYARFAGAGFLDQVFDLISRYDDILPAFFAVLIFFTVIVSSIVIIKKKWNYELFNIIHLAVYVAVLIAFGHQIELGGDFAGQPQFAAYWWLLYTAVFGFLVVYRFLLPLFNFNLHRFTVAATKKETPSVISINISGKDIDKFKVVPGQFMIFRFLAKGFWWQAHPFSLSGRGPGYIRLSVKAVGDYTAELQKIKPGTKVIIEGPYGVFTAKSTHKDKFLLIAGGIGITPLFAMSEYLNNLGFDTILLYGNLTERGVAFRDSLEKMSASKNYSVHHILSKEKKPGFEHGHIDIGKISRLAPDFKEREIYICGPPPMMVSLIKKLKTSGVREKNIHFERFSL